MEIERDSFEIIELTWPLDEPGSKHPASRAGFPQRPHVLHHDSDLGRLAIVGETSAGESN